VPLFAWLEVGNDEADSAPDLEIRIMQQDEHDEIWAAIGALHQPLREAILLRHWADYSYQEMAQILGCPLRTAQSRVRLAHQHLKKQLATEYAAQTSVSHD
jgi:RNA polymerase sigma-70 factor (ECF subfamily)